MRSLTRAATTHLLRTVQKSATFVTNSGAMAIGTVAMAAFGFAYWWLAARLFAPEVIGKASALLSVMGLIGLLGEAGLGTLLIGEIGRHPGRASGLVSAAASIGLGLALSLALLFAFGEAQLNSSGSPIEGWLVGIAFVLGCSLSVPSELGDAALVGNLRSTSRMIRQVLFSTFKLMLIAAAAAAGYTSNAAIILTWVAGLLISWIGLDLLTRGEARRLVGPPDFRALHVLRHKVFGHYALDVTIQAPVIIMPYLVLVLLSATANAAFVSLWMLVTMAGTIPAAMSTVLFPVIRANSTQFRHHMLVSLAVSLLFSLVCASIVLFYSEQILALFNPAYPKIAGSSLCLLGFSLVGSTFKYHACSLARLRDKMGKASHWFAFSGLLELCFAIAGAKLGGLQGLVVAWTIAISIEGACAALVLFFATTLDSADHQVREGPASKLLQT
ncbi:hypothetical protein RAD15_21845 [Bradyrhizobium sp. 14AA]